MLSRCLVLCRNIDYLIPRYSMLKLITPILILLCSITQAQDVHPSNTYVRTCLNDIECSSINSSSVLYYDEARAKFYIKIDFNALKTGIDSVDFWLDDLTDTYYYFKASLPPEELPRLSNYNRKTIRLVGQAFLNNIWRNQTIDITVFRAEDDMMSNTTDADHFHAYKVNLNFSIVPKDFKIHKKPQRLTNVIFVGIGAGRINALRAGMEGQLGEAFNHGSN
jgi:hypothetical protein